MANHDCRTRQLLAATLLLAPLLILCVLYLDLPVAVLVKTRLYSNAGWSALTSDLPDLLLLVVLLVTFAGLSVYLVRSKKGIRDRLTMLSKLVTWIAPVSFLAKNILKFVFGRVNTRLWVQDADFYGFHWFHGGHGFDGFPSGHMLVVVSLAAALCRYYPKYLGLSIAGTATLGAALIATNYHFVSDVVAGTYFGLLIECILFSLLLDESRRLSLHPLD